MTHSETRFNATSFLKRLPDLPGVYRMLGEDAKILYVGKARSLKKRVASYFRKDLNSAKTRALMAAAESVEFTVTHTEKEALILEHNLIKRHRPRFNVIFRDDKSYPYVYVNTDHAFPRFSVYRGSKRKSGRFFGPYPSAGSVRQMMNVLQKIFRIRQCEDSYFNYRSRPCLQYQINRCSAPCVGKISNQEYQEDVHRAVLLLEGKSKPLLEALVKRMEACSNALDFEKAARFRDQIKSINKICEGQVVEAQAGDIDVVFCQNRMGIWGVQLLFVRAGKVLGDRTFFPKQAQEADRKEVMLAFLQQHYLENDWPTELVLNEHVALTELQWAGERTDERHGKWPKISCPTRGIRQQWLDLASSNLQMALVMRLDDRLTLETRWQTLENLLGFESLRRVECFDISHISGTDTVGSCVVFGRSGAIRSQYRRFVVKGIKGGDDYAAMEQVLRRRYSRVKTTSQSMPDLVLIDGGKGQLKQAENVFEELEVDVLLIGVAKGPERIPGNEKLFLVGEEEPLPHESFSPALPMIQQIRDEAHRFAITGHRSRREKARKRSLLEDIPGVGPKRRRKLINYFGGAKEVSVATEEALCFVPGISREMAKRVFQYMNKREKHSG